jgi:hypothetical protein
MQPADVHRSPLGPAIDSLAASYKQLLDATLALNVAEVPYAVCGGFAVAAWCLHHERQLLAEEHRYRREGGGNTLANLVPPHPVTLVNTRDVDILVRRADFDSRVRPVLKRAGFAYVRTPGVELGMFVRAHLREDRDLVTTAIQGAEEGIHLLFAGEVGKDAFFENPDPDESTVFADVFGGADHAFRVLNLGPLLAMKLNYVSVDRLKDLVHLVELWESGALTDEVVLRVAFDPRWQQGDRLRQFHGRFRAVARAASGSALRRYAMRGEEIERHFYGVLARIVDQTAEELLAGLEGPGGAG